MRAVSSSEKAEDMETGFSAFVLVEAAGLLAGAAAGSLAMNTVERDTGKSPLSSDGEGAVLVKAFAGADDPGATLVEVFTGAGGAAEDLPEVVDLGQFQSGSTLV